MGGWPSAAAAHGNLTEPLMPFDADPAEHRPRV